MQPDAVRIQVGHGKNPKSFQAVTESRQTKFLAFEYKTPRKGEDDHDGNELFLKIKDMLMVAYIVPGDCGRILYPQRERPDYR
jgi:hypothetical protein